MWPFFNLDAQYAAHPEIKREDVQKLLQWVGSQPHMPPLTEHEVLLFFHACGHQMEYTKEVMDACYTFRTNNEEYFGNVDIDTPQMQLVQKTVAGIPLDKQTPEGYTVIVGKLVDTDASKFDFVGSLKLYCLGQEMYLLENDLIRGVTFVLDLTGVSFGHITRISISNLKNLMYFLQEAIPTRLISVHFVNAGTIIEKIMALINPFLKKELKEAFHIHTSLDSLYKYIPREILPQDFGGPQLPVIELRENFYQKLRNNRLNIIEYNASRQVKEKLRPAKTKKQSTIFGTQGNFKKLEFD